jgi:hypothetical protein
MVHKYRTLQTEDTQTFTKILRMIFKTHYKSSLIYCSPLILADLLKLCQQMSSKTDLSFIKTKVLEIYKLQRQEMQTTKIEIYNKISKFFPFDSPYYLLPRIQSLS